MSYSKSTIATSSGYRVLRNQSIKFRTSIRKDRSSSPLDGKSLGLDSGAENGFLTTGCAGYHSPRWLRHRALAPEDAFVVLADSINQRDRLHILVSANGRELSETIRPFRSVRNVKDPTQEFGTPERCNARNLGKIEVVANLHRELPQIRGEHDNLFAWREVMSLLTGWMQLSLYANKLAVGPNDHRRVEGGVRDAGVLFGDPHRHIEVPFSRRISNGADESP